MRLDLSYFPFLQKHEIRILTAVELGMRNHEWVPIQVIQRIAALPQHSFKAIRNLLKMKLLSHTGRKYDGYRLNSLGYDFLALRTLFNKGLVEAVHGKIGVGKQSDVYSCTGKDGKPQVLKITRLGRVSFRSVKNNRDYIRNRTQYNWLYLSRLSAIKQFQTMKVLHASGFPTPQPIEQNRHVILMSFIDGYPLSQLRSLPQPEACFRQCLQMLGRLAEHGLIHGDFNEFNLMMQDGKVKVIDFPQCISRSHPDAEYHYNRDVQCIYDYFDKLIIKNQLQQEFSTDSYRMPALSQITVSRELDRELKASGYLAKQCISSIDMDLIAQILHGKLNQQGQQLRKSQQDQQNEQQMEQQVNQESLVKKINQLEKLDKLEQLENEFKKNLQMNSQIPQFGQTLQNQQQSQCQQEISVYSETKEQFQQLTKQKLMYKPETDKIRTKRQRKEGDQYVKLVRQKNRDRKRRKGKPLDLCRNTNKGRTKVDPIQLSMY